MSDLTQDTAQVDPSTLQDIPVKKIEIPMQISASDANAAIDKELRAIASKRSVPGFRKGKVPLSMLKREYGDYAKYRALTDIFYNEAMKQIESKYLITPNLIDSFDLSECNEETPEVISASATVGYYSLDVAKLLEGQEISVVSCSEDPTEDVYKQIMIGSNFLDKVEGDTVDPDLVLKIDFESAKNVQAVLEEGAEPVFNAPSERIMDLSASDMFFSKKEEFIGKKIGEPFVVHSEISSNVTKFAPVASKLIVRVTVKEMYKYKSFDPAAKLLEEDYELNNESEFREVVAFTAKNQLEHLVNEINLNVMNRAIYEKVVTTYRLPQRMIENSFHKFALGNSLPQDKLKQLYPLIRDQIVGSAISDLVTNYFRKDGVLFDNEAVEAAISEEEATIGKYMKDKEYTRSAENKRDVSGAIYTRQLITRFASLFKTVPVELSFSELASVYTIYKGV